jgi:glycerol-1-phosphate dehydrogenase [NAD(P)+]
MTAEPRRVWPLPRVECRSSSRLEGALGLVTSEPIWQAVGSGFMLEAASRSDVTEATIEHWRELADGFEGDRICAIGGGLVVDAAKWMAAELDLELVSIPTALSVDAFFTWASGYREDGCVRYVETRPPDVLILDPDLLAAAPAAVRTAGLCDVLSIATGSFDWQFAERHGRNSESQRYLKWAADMAAALLDEALACAAAAGRGEVDGLFRLADLLALEVQLCNQIGHSRPEEGSEHYFAYSLENRVGKGLAHGDLVGPGIVLLARLQGLEWQRLEQALLEGGIPLGLMTEDVSRQTLCELPEYCQRQRLPFGRAHTLTLEEIEDLF